MNKIEPFNELYMDCVVNNLLAILKAHCDNFDELFPFLFSYNFQIVGSYIDSFPESLFAENLREGYLALSVSLNAERLKSLFITENINVTPSEDLHTLIQQRLDAGEYLFITVDCFYYRTGVFANKKHHIHPTFICHYDHGSRSYTLLEDCESLGRYHYYSISPEDLKLASLQSSKSQDNAYLCSVKLQQPKPNQNVDISYYIDKINSEVEARLWNKIVEYPKWKYQYDQFGINCIMCYADRFEQVLSCANNQLLLEFPLFKIINMHKLNLKLIHQLFSKSFLSQSQYQYFSENYLTLRDKWSVLRNKIIKYFITRKIDFAKSKTELHELHKMEYENDTRLLEILTRARP